MDRILAEDVHDADTASSSRGEGVRDVVLTDRWDTSFKRPNGGYVLALMLRGLTEEIGSGRPLVASVSYLAAPTAGSAELRTTVLGSTDRHRTASAVLVQDGRVTSQLTATFGMPTGDPQPGDPDVPTTDVPTADPPDLPHPDECRDLRATRGPVSGIFERVDHRLPPGPSVMLGQRSGRLEASLWQRLAGGRAIDEPALALLTDTCSPVVMEVGAAASLTVQLTVHLFGRPAPGWIATRVRTRHVRDGFHEEDCELFDVTGRLVARSRQLALLV